MLQMASVFRGSGFDNLGGPMGGQTQPSFPAPGNPNAPQSANSPTTPAAPGTTPAAGGTAPLPMYGQFGDPSALMQLLGGVGGAGFGAGAGATAPPAGPPPEERFQVQLQVRRLTLLGCWLYLAHVPLAAITRYGVHQRLSKRACTSCDRRECARCNRVYPRWRRIVGGRDNLNLLESREVVVLFSIAVVPPDTLADHSIRLYYITMRIPSAFVVPRFTKETFEC